MLKRLRRCCLIVAAHQSHLCPSHHYQSFVCQVLPVIIAGELDLRRKGTVVKIKLFAGAFVQTKGISVKV
jgi:hypothetical protein